MLDEQQVMEAAISLATRAMTLLDTIELRGPAALIQQAIDELVVEEAGAKRLLGSDSDKRE